MPNSMLAYGETLTRAFEKSIELRKGKLYEEAIAAPVREQ